MTYLHQYVGTPRFFMNVLEFMAEVGDIELTDVYRTLPVGDFFAEWTWDDAINIQGNYPHGYQFFQLLNQVSPSPSYKTCFFAILNHRLARSSTTDYPGHFQLRAHSGGSETVLYLTNYINSATAQYVEPEYNGFSFSLFGVGVASNLAKIGAFLNPYIDSTEAVGSVVIGTYYDMPQNPNFNLTLSYEYGHTNKIASTEGSVFTNSYAHGPNPWGYVAGSWGAEDATTGAGAWELWKTDVSEAAMAERVFSHALRRSGRRVWNMSFSYLDSGNLWGLNQTLNSHGMNLESLGYDDSDIYFSDYKYNLVTDSNFFSQVWFKSLGGTLPFIFMPNGGGNNPNKNTDQFAICRFADNSLKITQTAPNVYDVSLKIEEVW